MVLVAVCLSQTHGRYSSKKAFNNSTASGYGGGVSAAGLNVTVCFCVFNEDSARYAFGFCGFCTALNKITSNTFVKCGYTNTNPTDAAWVTQYGWTVSEFNNGSSNICRDRGACYVSRDGGSSQEIKFDMYMSNDCIWVFGLACSVNKSKQCVSSICLANNTAQESVYSWYGAFLVKNCIFSDNIPIVANYPNYHRDVTFLECTFAHEE